MATKSNLPPLFLLILIITLTSSHKVFAFEDGYKFLKKLDKDVQIDWVVNERKEERSCKNLSGVDKDLINKVIARCKIIREENIDPTDNNDSSYLMDSIGHTIYAKYFDPISIIDFGREYGISLSRRRESEILLLVDENGEFRESYAISGYIVNTTNAQKKMISPYPELLVGLSRDLDINKCIHDILAFLTEDYISKSDEYGYNYLQEISEYGMFYERQPLQIKIIVLPKRATGIEHQNIDFAIKSLIDQQISYVRLRQQDVGVRKEDGARFMVFLSINATNNEMLKELTDRYGEYIGKDVLANYKSFASCK